MSADVAKAAPPAADRRLKLVDATMRRHGYHPSALIETLHTVQETFGFLDEETMKYVAKALRTPLSKVYGVATFYHFFNLKPQGKHTCVICMGTACYIKGTQAILDRVEQDHGVKPGETTADGELSVMTARCVGACGLAPAVVFDGEVAGKLNADATAERIQKMVKP
jgi:bidirectional [NiFe] hydrogenase diaphorase subunit